MRRSLVAFALMSLACAGLGSPDGSNQGAIALLGQDGAPQVPPLMVEDQAPFADQFLLILGSYPGPGQAPESLKTLEAHPELGAKPARLSSSRFKNLQPCYEVVVAGAFSAQYEATQLSNALSKLGIDHTIKNAGTHIGSDPRVEAYCAHRSDTEASLGPAGARFAIHVGNRVHVPLHLDEVVLERALEGVAPPRKLDDAGSSWSSEIPVERLENVAIGDAFTLVDAAQGDEIGRCTVKGFSALTRGQPHFGWYEGDQSSPGCGSPEAFAALDCPVDGRTDEAWVAVPDGAAIQVYGHGSSLSEAEVEDARTAALKDPKLKDLYDRAVAEAKEVGRPIEQTWTVELYTLTADQEGEERDVPVAAVVQVDLIAGPEEGECGTNAVDLRAAAVYFFFEGQLDGPAVPWQDITYAEVDGMVLLGKPVLLVRREFGGREMVGESGIVNELDEAFCDCPC